MYYNYFNWRPQFKESRYKAIWHPFWQKRNTFCANKNVAKPFTICGPLNVFTQVELKGTYFNVLDILTAISTQYKKWKQLILYSF